MRILVAAAATLMALVALGAEPEAAPQQAPPRQAVPTPPSVPADKPAVPATRERGTMDRLELDTTAIIGNRELPKVMYVVPWKRADLGDLAGKPANSLLDEALAPVDRAVFRREVRYFGAVETAAPARAETPVTAPVGQP